MELLLIRHALPIRIDEGSVAGAADPQLADLGVTQAKALAEWLADERVDALWCSPMLRARETAQPVGDRLGLEITYDEGLAEYDRESASYIPVEELKAAGDPRWHQVPEQPEHFKAVVVETVERIVAAHPRQNVGGRLPRRCHQRLHRPRPRRRGPAVLPAPLHEHQPRPRGEHWRAQHLDAERDGAPSRALSTGGRSPRTGPPNS